MYYLKSKQPPFFWQNLRTWQCFVFCFFKFLKSLGDSMFPQVWGDSTTSIWVLVKASITNPTHSFFEFPDKISLQTKKPGLFSFFFGQPYPNLIQRLTIWGFGPELKEISSGGSFGSSWYSFSFLWHPWNLWAFLSHFKFWSITLKEACKFPSSSVVATPVGRQTPSLLVVSQPVGLQLSKFSLDRAVFQQ